MKPFAQSITGRRRQNRVCFFVCKAVRTTNDAPRKACAPGHATFVELDKNRTREPIHFRLKAATTVAKPLRQQRDEAVGGISAVAVPRCLAVQRAAWLHVGGNICGVNAELPTAVCKLLHVNGVVE